MRKSNKSIKEQKELKDANISIRCTRNDKAMIESKAAKAGMKTGEYIIMCVEAKNKRSYEKILRGELYKGICDLITQVNLLPCTEENKNIRKAADSLCASLNI